MLLKGLETLEIRVERETATAPKLADLLAAHPRVTRVLYPGRADHPQAELAAAADARRLQPHRLRGRRRPRRRLQVRQCAEIVRISNNLGDAKSLITHPSTTTHQRLSEEARQELGITQGMLRLSVGLEDPDDLAEDLAEALAAVGSICWKGGTLAISCRSGRAKRGPEPRERDRSLGVPGLRCTASRCTAPGTTRFTVRACSPIDLGHTSR